MHRSISSFIAVCLFVVLGLRASAAWAQQDEDAIRLDPLIVTATRSAERLSRTTRSVTVISAEDIAAQGAETVADVLRSVPGMEVVRQGSLGGVTSIFARGAESDHTVTLIDGVKVNLGGGQFDMADLSVDNIERIEVVRGPTSTLYGSGAIGGVIHIITRRGRGPLSASLSASVGSFNTHTQRAAVSVGESWGGLSLSASRLNSEGHLAFNNDYDNANLALRADLYLDERTDVSLMLRHTDSEFHFPTDSGGRVRFHNQFSTTHETALGLRGTRALLPWWTTSVQVGSHNRNYRLHDESGTAYAYAEERLALDWHSVLMLGLGELTLGAAYDDEDDTESNYGRHNAAGYAQLRMKPMEPMVLIGGLRVEGHSEFGTELTYQFSAAYFLPGGTKLRAALGSGFKAPTLFENLSTLPGALGNPNLDPERSTTWELGVEHKLWADRLRFEGTFFSSRFKDLIDWGPAPQGQPNYFNIQEAEAHGLELSATVTPLPAWTFGSAYTWLRSEVTDAGFSTSATAAFVEGESLLRRPEHKVHAFGSYAQGRFNGRLDLHHIGVRNDRHYPGWPQPTRAVDNRSYTKVNVVLGYKLIAGERRTLELFGRVENLFDEDYYEVYGFATPGFAAFGGIRMTL